MRIDAAVTDGNFAPRRTVARRFTMLDLVYALLSWALSADSTEPSAELNAGLVIDYDG